MEDALKSRELGKYDISKELWRSYSFPLFIDGEPMKKDGKILGTTYVINNPVLLVWSPGRTTHRVVDAKGIVHCVPAPGERGCVLRWFNGDSKNPVNF